MAIHSGRKKVFSVTRGTVLPRNRALGPIGRAVFYELPGATSNIRTTARVVDMSTVTVRAVGVEADLRAVVAGSLDMRFDIGVLAVRPVTFLGDLHMTIWHVLDLRPDSRTAVFGPTERLPDSALVVVRPMTLDLWVKQAIYVYLFRESHEIQV